LLRSTVLALCAITGLTGCTDHTPNYPGAVFDGTVVDAALRGIVDDGLVVGSSALVFINGEEVYYGAFGLADREAGTEMKRDTLAHIWSMTKPVTGVALMTLFEQSKFKFDDPLAQYLPYFTGTKVYAGEDENGEIILEEPGRQILIADILRHTAGFGVDEGAPGLQKLYQQSGAQYAEYDPTLAEFAEWQAGMPLLYHPGDRWFYSSAVDIQAHLIEILSGEAFADYVQHTLFDPLGMTDTGWWTPIEKHDRVAGLYEAQDGELVREPKELHYGLRDAPANFTPGGWGLTTTLDDYMKFAQMLVHEGELNGVRILQPETVRLMATDHLPKTVGDRSWLPSKGQVGFGVDFAVRIATMANAEEKPGVVGEFFWDGRSSTLFWVDPVNRLTAVLFVQVIPFSNDIHKIFRDAVYSAFDAEGLGEIWESRQGLAD